MHNEYFAFITKHTPGKVSTVTSLNKNYSKAMHCIQRFQTLHTWGHPWNWKPSFRNAVVCAELYGNIIWSSGKVSRWFSAAEFSASVLKKSKKCLQNHLFFEKWSFQGAIQLLNQSAVLQYFQIRLFTKHAHHLHVDVLAWRHTIYFHSDISKAHWCRLLYCSIHYPAWIKKPSTYTAAHIIQLA